MLATIQSRAFCLLSKKSKNENIRVEDYNFACDFVWVRNLVSDTKGGTYAEDVWEQGAEEDIGPKRDEVTGGWRKLHNEELRNLYSSISIIRIIKSRRMRWAGHVARMGEKRNEYRLLVGKSEGKRPLGRPRRRWVDNIKMDLGYEPSGSIKCWETIKRLHNWWPLE
jgi:hypothetical protein